MTDYSQTIIDIGYIVASILFILGIKMLGKPQRARMGNMVSALGMLIAITAVLFECCLSYEWVIAGILMGSLIGAIAARTVQMTAMPQMVAVLNGFGGIASLLVGWENFHSQPDSNLFVRVAILLAVLIGGIAFSGSLVAYGKLAGRLSGRPILFRGQQLINAALFAVILVCGAFLLYQDRKSVV
jgi:NAD(P) transhydrogenase subunit beta